MPDVMEPWITERRESRDQRAKAAAAIAELCKTQRGPWSNRNLVTSIVAAASVASAHANRAIWSMLADGRLKFDPKTGDIIAAPVNEPNR